ncbi:hypothetical protein SERLA73DRAFT_118865 [Serpula lacrymans var. lacrymans S7.3]|uniref:Lipase-like C-terminal domain-containing protein n=2 Tax=Serpula lacrymans var. lacrymans TaxID=341189 RepID=F8PFL5_SERL3|nr:uncharacterized protein SERLADRAFT_364902 [Serpula lacrymans var. lacrymans S7.9]EGO05304.1 hypothetical protein SERLA73DRAFT_118865 [Serpula lacrymans var. lacrymans S7.3]EGO31161.1 hypothetical protein SERLADRAFT_364902 [Serpula lacrymans var. lacrymans S7.9]
MPGAVDHKSPCEVGVPRPQDEPIPVVIVDGFLGGTGALLWGNFEHYLNIGHEDSGLKKRRTIFVRCVLQTRQASRVTFTKTLFWKSVGPVSSLHDRACELFYALCGGTVDYGEQHALEHGHSRYGRTNQEGLYPEWSTGRPLHFLGHSMGGPTIVKLQWLMHTGFFGTHVHPDMVLSVTAISSPLRGTQLVYILGERIDAAPAVRPLSLGTALSKIVHIISFFSPPTHSPFDFHSESRKLSYRETSWKSFWKQLKKSDWAESRDAAPFDVTFEAADEREAVFEGIPNKNSFYRAYAAEMVNLQVLKSFVVDNNLEDWKGTRRLFAVLDIFSPLYLSSRFMASFDFSSLQPQPSFMSQVATSHDGCDDLESGVLNYVDTTQWRRRHVKGSHCPEYGMSTN